MPKPTDRERIEALGLDAALDHATKKKRQPKNTWTGLELVEVRIRLGVAAEQLREAQRILRVTGDVTSAEAVAEVGSELEDFRLQLQPKGGR